VNNPSGAKTKAIIYVRVSTDKQGQSGLGAEAQHLRCQQYAASNDVLVVDVITDVESGGDLDRPGLKKALAALENGQANAILISNLDRLTRDTEDGLSLTKKYFGEDSDYLLLSAGENIDPRTADGEFFLTIQLAIARRELRRIRERTKSSLAVKSRQLAKTGEQLGAPTAEQKVPEATQLVLKLHSDGVPERQIAEILNQRGVPTARGGQWRQNIVQNIIKRDKAKKAAEAAVLEQSI